jgi:tRNA(Ile)-lysidine synthase
LYIQQPLPEISDAQWLYQWDGEQALDIPELHGQLMLQPVHGSGIRQSLVEDGLTIRPRSGGERFRPAGDKHRRALKTIFQNHHIPPWERARLPLIFHGDSLLAVADIEISHLAAATDHEAGYRVIWQSVR